MIKHNLTPKEYQKLISKFRNNEINTIRNIEIINSNEYPSEFVTTDLDLYVNLLDYSDLSFLDLIFHLCRAILCEIICFETKLNEKIDFDCGLDCIPHQMAHFLLKLSNLKYSKKFQLHF